MVFGVISGVLAVALLYLLTMLIYFRCRKRFAHRRLTVDVAVILIALLASVSVRAAVLFSVPGTGVGTGFNRVIYIIYSAIGGLTFEGLDAEAVSVAAPAVQCLYYGVILYAGLVALSVVTARISYELYSSFCFLALRGWYRLRGYDLYIFSSVSRNVLLLAGDISREYERAQREPDCGNGLAGRHCAIIFAGNELGSFDRKSELHREIMERGYYYHSYCKRRSKRLEPSLLRALGLQNYGAGRADEAKRPRICIFAMRQSGEMTGAEAKNSDFVLDDVTYMLREIEVRTPSAGDRPAAVDDRVLLRGHVGLVVEYFVLTNLDLNYQFYEQALKNAVNTGVLAMRKRSAGKHTGKIGRAETDDGLARILMRKFQLHILNEALLTAHDLTASRAEAFEAADASAADGVPSVFLRDIGMTEDAPAENVYRVVVFGDGAAAQSAAGQLFVQTASVDAEGRSSLFLADVFVADARGQMGWSGVEHPLCHCVDCGEEPCLLPVEEVRRRVIPGSAHDALYRAYERYERGEGRAGTDARAYVDAHMGFPILCFHAVSSDAAAVREVGRCLFDREYAGKRSLGAVLVCFDDDELNLRVANALIASVEHGVADDGLPAPLTIYVHIRDEKNRDRLNWTEQDRQYFCSKRNPLLVIPFGNRESMYSYAGILDERHAERYNYIYQAMCSDLGRAEQVRASQTALPSGLAWIAASERLLNGESEDGIACLKVCSETIREKLSLDLPELHAGWLDQGAYLRESNESVHAYSVVYRKYLERAIGRGTLSREDILRLTTLEKLRWNRFYMANGWVFGQYPARNQREMRRRWKIHDGLTCFGMSSISYRMYDLINVMYSCTGIFPERLGKSLRTSARDGEGKGL